MSWKSKRGPLELLFYFTSLSLSPSSLHLSLLTSKCQILQALLAHNPFSITDMGSLGNPVSSPPYTTSYNNYNYRDCSLEICSIYCPQFCYLIFPPPPPSDDGTPFSPLIIAIIGVLASAFILVSYYTIVTKYCRRRNPVHSSGQDHDHNGAAASRDQFQNGLDESQIRVITVLKYQKGEGLVDGNECAVCLSEFQENESLRLLPKCDHAFHLPCIDTWLKSHSNCPMCRANAAPTVPVSGSGGSSEARACEVRRPDDLVLVVDDDQGMVGRVVCEGGSEQQEGERSGFSQERPLMISDILRIDEDLGVKSGESSKRRDHKGKSSSVLPH